MSVKMPTVETVFSQLASSFIARSARGIAILVLRDDTDETLSLAMYANTLEANKDKARYTSENHRAMLDTLSFAPYALYVVRIGTAKEPSAATDLIERNVKTGWIAFASGTAEDDAHLIAWIRTQEKKQNGYKAFVYQGATPDSMHICSFQNETVTFADARGTCNGRAYLPSLIGIAATCNVSRGMTNYLCKNLTHVTEAPDNDAAVGKGQFILYNDEEDEVRIGVGVNTLQTLEHGKTTEDMKYVDVVEAMDMIREDINRTFRRDFLANYKNKQDNQMLFVSAVLQYLRDLAKEDVLDPDYPNTAGLNAAAQRDAWVAAGKQEAAGWDDANVLAHPYKRNLYLSGDIKILQGMDNMRFEVSLF